MTIEQTLTTPGERLKRARILAGLTTRREFEQTYHISANTLQGWEQGKNPLSEKGARRVVEALKKQGLICSIEWLLYGSGMPPRPYEMLNAGLKNAMQQDDGVHHQNLKEEERIYQEIQYFKQHNPNAIILSIADDAMEPHFSVGDYIGGVQIQNEELNQYLNTLCILELENNLILPRYLQAGTQEGLYNCACTNSRTTATPLNLFNVKIISAAPIVWHRRKLTSMQRG